MGKAGRVEEGLKLARKADSSGPSRVWGGVGVVAEGLVEAGRIDEAVRASRAVTDASERDRLLLSVVAKRVELGHVDHARKFVGEIKDRDVRGESLAFIAKGLWREHADAEAMEAVREALRLTNTLRYEHQQVTVLLRVARAFPQ
jgi:hypothetical protein